MIRRLLSIPVLLVAATAHADAVGEAQALFDQGITDLRAERYDQACKELGASLAKHADSGTKGALGVCLTKLGKIATAWQLWRDLADTEPDPELRKDAAKNAADLEPRLPRYVVKVAGAPVDGLVVTVNGGAIDLSVSVPLPVDPGPIAVTAHAPDHDDWAHKFDAVEGKTTTIDVPALVAHPHATAGGGTYDDSARRSRHKLAIGVAAVGGAAIVAGVVFGAVARSKWNTAQADCGASITACPGADFARSKQDFDSANSAATTSDVLFIAGGVALAGAAIAWFTAPHETLVPQRTVRLTPALDSHGAGFAVSGAW